MLLFQQMQSPSLILILVLALALAQCTWMKWHALVMRLTSLTAPEALLSAALPSTQMQEHDAKVWSYDDMMLHFNGTFLEFPKMVHLQFTKNGDGHSLKCLFIHP